jgi:hypothetical protein
MKIADALDFEWTLFFEPKLREMTREEVGK